MTIRLLFFLMIFFSHHVSAAENPIVILFSDDNESYQIPVKPFKEKMNQEFLEFNLKGDVENAPAVMNRVMQHKPSLIFALGAKAAWFAKIATRNKQETKVVFAMVINWQRYNLMNGQSNITGISSEIAPGTQLINLSLLSPEIRRIGAIYSDLHSESAIKKAKSAAELLGLELKLKSIKHPSEFRRAWRQISGEIEAYWVFTDPVLYTMNNIHWLNNRCLKEKLLCIGQSDNIAKLGVLLSINPDYETIGVQAAAIARTLIENKRTTPLSHISDPIGTKITLNKNTAKKIGLEIQPEVLSMVNEVVGQ